MSVFDKRTFHGAKSWFTLACKNLCDWLARQALDFNVAVEQTKPHALRYRPAHRRLPCAHETDKIEIGFGCVHRKEEAQQTAPGCRCQTRKAAITVRRAGRSMCFSLVNKHCFKLSHDRFPADR
jgi:hypothetical protein